MLKAGKSNLENFWKCKFWKKNCLKYNVHSLIQTRTSLIIVYLISWKINFNVKLDIKSSPPSIKTKNVFTWNVSTYLRREWKVDWCVFLLLFFINYLIFLFLFVIISNSKTSQITVAINHVYLYRYRITFFELSSCWVIEEAPPTRDGERKKVKMLFAIIIITLGRRWRRRRWWPRHPLPTCRRLKVSQ